MRIDSLPIMGVYAFVAQRHVDKRGWYDTLFTRDTYEMLGLCSSYEQEGRSYTPRQGTFRGMHYQENQVKLVRCFRGIVMDFLVDLRKASPTYLHTYSLVLRGAEISTSVYIPAGVAHGYQTLTDDVEMHYLMSTSYDPALQRGVRWNDPAFTIRLPSPLTCILDRDASFPDHVR